MANQEPGSDGTPNSDYEPDFVMPNHDVIHEDNWEEYKARGFVPTLVPPSIAAGVVGIENVYTGDAYDYKAGRPLRHSPDAGQYAYLGPEGAKREKEVEAAQESILRSLGYYGSEEADAERERLQQDPS